MAFIYFLFISFDRIKEIIVEKIKEAIIEILERLLDAIQSVTYVNL
jgi:hypothetical protein